MEDNCGGRRGCFKNAGVKKDREGGGVVASKFRHGLNPFDVHIVHSQAVLTYARCLQTYLEENSQNL